MECFNTAGHVAKDCEDWWTKLGHPSPVSPVCISSYCSTINRRTSFPMEGILSYPLKSPIVRNIKCLDDYKVEMVQNMSSAWQLAHNVIRKSKSKQKAVHDKKESDTTIRLGDKIRAYVSYQEWATLQVSSTI